MDFSPYPLLKNYQGPFDLQKMSEAQLIQLADEVRQFLLNSLDRTGGHLSSNLGVVELTIAILYVFDFREDKIIFDVGHQSYVYKLLTDRKDQFTRLRQKNGLSGFPKRNESNYDFFNTGHASTSLSAILGISTADRLFKSEEAYQATNYLALIGDGALTGGLSFEAINNMSEKDNVLIILNDNQMSIAKNVGSLHRHLEQLRISKSYLRLKPKLKRSLKSIPIIGKFTRKIISHLKKIARRSLGYHAGYFDYLGLRYYGPCDGHNIGSLIHYLENIKNVKGPKILHICTQKGKGYLPAEEKPDTYHGVKAAFVINDQQDGSMVSSAAKSADKSADKLVAKSAAKSAEQSADESADLVTRPQAKKFYKSYTDVFSKTLLEKAEKDEKIVAITAAMPEGTGLLPFAELYKNRFFDVGIAEAHAVTFAAGLVSGEQSLKPVVAIYSTFLQRAYDQLLHDCCLQKLPILFVVDRAGIVGADGETHQGIMDIGYLSSMPYLEIYSPFAYQGLANILTEKLQKIKSPTVIRFPRGESFYAKIENASAKQKLLFSHYKITQEKEDYYQVWQQKEGKADLLIICDGSRADHIIEVALEVIEKQAKAKSQSEVQSKSQSKSKEQPDFQPQPEQPELSAPKTFFDICILERIKPLNYTKLKELCSNYKKIVTFEEAMLRGGLGEHISASLNASGLSRPFKHLGINDSIVEQASYEESLAEHQLDVAAILQQLKNFMVE